MTEFSIDRRVFLAGGLGVGAVALAGCASSIPMEKPKPVEPQISQSFVSMYRAMPEERFPVPAVDLKKIPQRFYRRIVEDPTGEPPGTVYVDTKSFYLYFVGDNGMAHRYGVGLGRAGFEWSGRARIAWKQEWPKWTPPEEMIARSPDLAKYSAESGGMPPGLDNPLGARALYIFKGKVDTLFRVHGTGEYWSIGKAVSSGCVRLLNQDVIDLYERVPKGAPIVVA